MNSCKSFARYKGKRPPRCNGGGGCWACWAVYLAVNGHKATP